MPWNAVECRVRWGMTVRKVCRSGDVRLIWVSLAVMALFAVEVAPAAGALPMKACQLITAKDVQGVLGGGYAQEEVLDNQVQSYCVYKKAEGTAVGVQLSRQIMDAGQYLEMVQASMKREGKPVTPVAGLGKGAALMGYDEQKNIGLTFGKGTLLASVSVFTGGKPNVDAAQKLATIAYSRLP